MTPPAMPTRHAFDDARMEALMGRLLQGGVLLASAVVLLGGILFLHAAPGARADYRHFAGEPGRLRHPLELLHGVTHGEPAAIIQLGVLLLIATPVARVLLAAVAFALERDRLYLAISLIVLAVLLLGLFRIV